MSDGSPRSPGTSSTGLVSTDSSGSSWVTTTVHQSPVFLYLPDLGLFFFLTAASQSQPDLASGAQLQQPQSGQPQDYHKLFAAEKENLQLAQGLYKWSVEDVDVRVLQKYGKLPKSVTS